MEPAPLGLANASLAPINMLWVGETLPWYARASVRSFLHHGHRVRLHAYDEVAAPPGVELVDASSTLGRDKVFGYKAGPMAGHLSGFADWFRYELLLKEGGWWADADVICLRAFRHKSPFVFASGWEPGFPRYVNNNVIFAALAGSPLMQAAAEECRRLASDVEHAQTGPVLLHRLVGDFGQQACVTRPDVFNPIHYGDIQRIARDSAYVAALRIYRLVTGRRPLLLNRRTAALHLYSALLRAHLPIESTDELPKGSLLRKLLARNGALD